ncbi:MAG: ATP-binding protein, partial [Eggerthellaceae bacterium]|nr:ATP-binding protein [Eggerthellaceae bacterium]
MQIPLSIVGSSFEWDALDKQDSTVLFDGDTGEVLLSEHGGPEQGTSLFSFLDLSLEADENWDYSRDGAQDPDVAQTLSDLKQAIEDAEPAVITADVDGTESFICIVPTGKDNWYAANIIPVTAVRSDADAATFMMGVIIALSIACMALGILVAFILYRYEARTRGENMRNDLYQAFSDTLDCAVFLYCPELHRGTRIVYKSKDIFGVSLEDLINHPELARHIDVSAGGLELLEQVQKGDIKGVEKGEFTFVDAIGSTRYIEFGVRPLYYEDKDQILVILQDVTEDRLMEVSMKEAMQSAQDANSAKSEFLSQMSHEIRTPMNVIVGKLAIARKHIDEPGRLDKSLNDIEEASSNLIELVNEVLDISKIESGKTNFSHKPYKFSKMLASINKAIEPQCIARHQTYIFTTSGNTDSIIVGDEGRGRRMLLNLLTNAVKYTPEYGTIRFDAKVATSHATGYATLTFTVADNGIGMSREYLE